MREHDALLTGVARSGTTLACELLNRVPDTVALDEPITADEFTLGRPLPTWDEIDRDAISDMVERFLDSSRESLLARGTARSKHVEGQVRGAKFADREGEEGLRVRLARMGELRVDKELSAQFLLVVKQPAAFTAIIEQLAERFRVFAFVRNPLSVLSSWQTVPFPVQEGHHRIAERLDLDLKRALASIDDRVERQLHLLSWFYAQYRDVLPDERVIRYESLVESSGRSLGVITERAQGLDEPLENRNLAAVYDRGAMRRLGERMLAGEGAYWHYYSRQDVKDLIEA